jgi:hypothetical protein
MIWEDLSMTFRGLHLLSKQNHQASSNPLIQRSTENSVTQRNNQNNPSNNQSQSVNQTKSKKNYGVVHPQNHHPVQAVRCVLARQNFAAGPGEAFQLPVVAYVVLATACTNCWGLPSL